MKNIKLFLYAFTFLITLTSCLGDDEDTTPDCYTCTESQTAYCYTSGDSYYTVTQTDNTTQEQEITNHDLAGRSWSSYKIGFFAICENGGVIIDCYTCSVTNTTYCYSTGDIEYSITVNDDEPTYESIAVGEWEITKRASFESECISGLPGFWKMTDYVGTARTESTLEGDTSPTIITTSTMQGTSYSYAATFLANPNEVSYSGTLDMHIISTLAGVDTETDVTTPIADPTIKKMWSLDGNTLTIADDFFEEYNNTLVSVTETTLKIRTETKITIIQDGYTHVATDDVTTTYERE